MGGIRRRKLSHGLGFGSWKSKIERQADESTGHIDVSCQYEESEVQS